jgi:putative ABC transport system permease protein
VSTPSHVPGRSVSTYDVAARRAQAPHTSMLVRMLVRAAVLRRGRAAAALLAMVVAAAVATAMLSLFADVQAKLRNEFRNYGANIVVTGKDGSSLPDGTLTRVDLILAGRGMAAPFAMVVARTKDSQPVVVVGTDFERVPQLDKWWSVSKWPEIEATPRAENAREMGHAAAADQALVGVKALAVVSPRNQPFELGFQGHEIQIVPTGTVQTGAAEDSRAYLSMSDFVAWTGVQPQTIEVGATGSADEVRAIMQQLKQAVPEADVRPVRQLVEGEARVLGKTRATLLMSTALIILTAALCVLSTLMGWVFDRRRDFAIMKTLGASDRLLNGFFAAEAAALGAMGAVIGFVLGIGIAEWIGQVNFHASVAPRFGVLPFVLVGSILVTLLSAILPVSLLRRVQPAVILRGE